MPTIFGVSHILFLLISTTLIVVGITLFKKHVNEKRVQEIIFVSTAAVLLVLIILNRISVTFADPTGVEYSDLVPMTLCGATSLLFAVFTLVFVKKQNHPIFHFLVYIAIVGGVLNNVYPDYIGQAPSIFHSRTITGLLHHTVSLFLGLLFVVNGEFKPSFKDSHWLPLGLFFYTTIGLFYVQAFSPRPRNSMNITQPILPGFYWYTMYAIGIVLHFGILFAFELYKERKRMGVIEQ